MTGLFYRKTANEVVEVHPSSTETAAPIENVQDSSIVLRFPRVDWIRDVPHREKAVRQRAHQTGGWLLSGIVCINILILGCSLVSASALNSAAITAVHRQIFLIFLLLITMMWMLFYTVITSRKDQRNFFKDSHAGPVWLKGEKS